MDTFSVLKRVSLYIFFIAVITAAAFLAIHYLLPAVLPFIIALLIAAIIRKPVRFLRKKAHIPEKLSASLAVIIITGVLCLISYYLLSRGYEEIVSFIENVGKFIERLKSDEQFATEIIEKINAVFPFWDLRPRLTELWIDIDASLETLLLGIAEKLSSSVLPVVTGALSFVPEALLFIFVTVLSAYYISVGGSDMKSSLYRIIPEKASNIIENAIARLKETIGGFVRAYALIMSITFTELFVMFSIVKIKYAFLIALFTAVVDILPVLGTGTVLIPWSILLFITGDTKKGIAIIVIYGIITLIRQLIEPKIVANSIGISPFASLAAMYIGLRLFGAVGLFICPLAVIAAQNIIRNKKPTLKIDNSTKKLL